MRKVFNKLLWWNIIQLTKYQMVLTIRKHVHNEQKANYGNYVHVCQSYPKTNDLQYTSVAACLYWPTLLLMLLHVRTCVSVRDRKFRDDCLHTNVHFPYACVCQLVVTSFYPFPQENVNQN